MIVSVYADGSWRVAKSLDYLIDASFPDFVASGEVDACAQAKLIEAQFEGDALGAIEEGLARGFALGLLAASGIETEDQDGETAVAKPDAHPAQEQQP